MTMRRTIRRRVMGTQTVTIGAVAPARSFGSGATRVLIGFGLVLALGTGLLMTPWAAEQGRSTSFVDALFTAVSAICVTGHTVVETQTHWSFFGEAVILALIQIGGLGYMLGASIVFWALGRRLGLRDRHFLRLYYGAPSMGETVSFARNVALFAFSFELAGAVLLWLIFVGDGLAASTSLWWSIFHSISAFNNAGFNVTGNDLLDYSANVPMLMTITVLVVAGGLGAIPVTTVIGRRRWHRLPIDHRLIFITTGAILLVGTVVISIFEWTNSDSIGSVTVWKRPVLALFEAAMGRTAGFSAVDVADMHDETKFFYVGIMFIGGAAGSTAGGIKVGTFALLLVAILAAVGGREEVTLFRRRIPRAVVQQALTIALLGVAFAFAYVFFVALTVDRPFIDIMFDTVSALGTVGASTGVVATMDSVAGKLLVISAMLVGRFGPLLLVLHMTRPRKKSTIRLPEDSIRLG
ncbi:MAG: TrkH family potassium uptake protein [Dehalococcoidia bacterium]